MSITLTLPVEILENIDIVTTQANQITKLRLQLEEANVSFKHTCDSVLTAHARTGFEFYDDPTSHGGGGGNTIFERSGVQIAPVAKCAETPARRD